MHVPHSIYCEYKNHEKEGFYMLNGDTVKLLRECNAGTKMAVYSMDEICDKISDADLKISSWHLKKNMRVSEMRSMHS